MKNFKKVTNVFFALIILVLAGFTPIKKSGEQVSESTTTVSYIADLTTVFPNPDLLQLVKQSGKIPEPQQPFYTLPT